MVGRQNCRAGPGDQTTGDLLGYAERVPFGEPLSSARPREASSWHAASLNHVYVTDRLFSMRGFALGVPFAKKDLDESPRLPRLARASNGSSSPLGFTTLSD